MNPLKKLLMKEDKKYLEELVDRKLDSVHRDYMNCIRTYIGTTIAVIGISLGLYMHNVDNINEINSRIDETYSTIQETNKRIDTNMLNYTNRFEEMNKSLAEYQIEANEKFYSLLEEIRNEK